MVLPTESAMVTAAPSAMKPSGAKEVKRRCYIGASVKDLGNAAEPRSDAHPTSGRGKNRIYQAGKSLKQKKKAC